jgi:S1-C subfamily serine protease
MALITKIDPKTAQRTTMPFDGAFGELTPLSEKSRYGYPMGGNTRSPSITDIHGRGNWGVGEDDYKSYKEKGDEYMMDNTMIDILKRINQKKIDKKEKWILTTKDGKIIEFPSYDAAQHYIQKDRLPYVSLVRRVANSELQRKIAQTSIKKFNYIDKTLNATFQIQSYNPVTKIRETGSAFAIASGNFLTCAHCVKKYNKFDMPANDTNQGTELFLSKHGEEYPAELTSINFSLDAAVIKCDVQSEILQIGSSDKTAIGTSVIAVGSPSGFEDNVTEGILSSKNRSIFNYDNAPTFLFTDAQVLPGSSGGPLVSLENGMVIGMMALIISDVGLYGLNAAIPSEHLIDFIG